MKSNYEKYIEEVWDMKDCVYKDFIKSGCSSYVEYIKKELKSLHMEYTSEDETLWVVRDKPKSNEQ